MLRDCAAAVGLAPGADLAPVLGTTEATDGPAQQLRLFDSVGSYLCEVARSGPLVVVLEDLHVADQASLDLLRFLVTSLRATRWRWSAPTAIRTWPRACRGLGAPGSAEWGTGEVPGASPTLHPFVEHGGER